MRIKNLNGVAPRYLRVHLKRTLLTILGVVLSVALVCAASLFGKALVDKGVEEAKLAKGSFYATIEGLSRAQAEQVSRNARVDQAGIALEAGAAMVSDSLSLVVIGGDQAFLRGMNLVVTKGRMPAAPGEIVVEAWAGDAMGRPLEIGSTIQLLIAVRDGAGGAYLRTARRSFTVCGFLEGWKITQADRRGFGVVSLEEARLIRGADEAAYMASFTTRAGLPVQESIAAVAASLNVKGSQVSQNTPLLTAMGVGASSVMNQSVRRVEAILALIIVLATIAVISNTFSISVLERVRQFGILRCVGATPSQLRRLILREALVVSAVGIPLGIGSGVGAVLVVARVLSMISTSFFGSLHVTLSAPLMLLSAGLGLFTVFLSALGPSVRAGRVPPLEALRAPERIVKERVRSRGHRLMRRLFGVAGGMAAQNLVRNRRRFLVTVGSIMIGITLFIVFASMLGIMTVATASLESQPFARDVAVYSRGMGGTLELTPRDLDQVRTVRGVRAVLATREANGRLLLPDDAVTADFRGYLDANPREDVPRATEPGVTALPATLLGLGPAELDAFKAHLIEGGIDSGAMSRRNGVYVVRELTAGRKAVVPARFAIGDRIRIVGSRLPDGPAPVELVVLGFARALTWSAVTDGEAVGVIMSAETFAAVTGKDTYTRFDVALADKARAREVAEILRAVPARAHGARVEDFTNAERENAGIVLQISILLYGLVAVITLIGALNIVNTIGTSLILRVREFGMLRAVGMTDRQLRGMVGLEGLLYGLYSAVPGSVIGLLLARLLFSNVNTVRAIPWIVPWQQMLGACAGAIALGVLSALVPMRGLARQSVVESIRAEE
jgi:putative ABC transport system permease protein